VALEPFDVDALDDEDPFEIDHRNAPHLAKHEGCDAELLYSMWAEDPQFHEAKYAPAHWYMVAKVAGTVYCTTLMPSTYSGPGKCRPIGLMEAPLWLVDEWRKMQSMGDAQ
jgi:hypothetical protein